MSDFQQLIIVGRVVEAVRLQHSRNGNAAATFLVAVVQSWLDDDAQPISKTTNFTILCWNQLANQAKRELQLGDRILIVGTIDVRTYLSRDSKPVVSLEIRAKQFKLLEKQSIDDYDNGLANSFFDFS